MNPRVVAIVQARCGSSRLPGKALRPLAGRPLIAHVLERAQAITGVQAVVMATTNHTRDDLLVRTGLDLGVQSVRGDEHDVLARVTLAARLTRADVVMRLTGDCPLLCPVIARTVLGLFHRTDRPYVWNDTTTSGFPDGTDVEVFDRLLLENALMGPTTPEDREHVTPWMRREVRPYALRAPTDYSRLKLSVDTYEDLLRVGSLMRFLPPGALTFPETLRAAFEAGLV